MINSFAKLLHQGFSHAFVLIPKGNHKIEIAQTDGYVNGDPGKASSIFVERT